MSQRHQHYFAIFILLCNMAEQKPTSLFSFGSSIRKRQRNKKASTQYFLPIAEIRNDTVLLKKGGLRAVLLVEPLNFNLKSETEQQGIISGYEEFINTLTFPLQIVMRSTKVNIDPYIDQIRERGKTQKNPLLKEQTTSYANFIEKIVDVAEIMTKRFYVIVPVDYEAQKSTTLTQFFSWMGIADTSGKATLRRKYFVEKSTHLKDRINLVEAGLNTIGLQTRRMSTSELIELYYKVYNPRTSMEQKLPDDLKLSNAML